MFNNLGNLFKHISFADENTAIYSTEPEPSALYLTHSELQQVQGIMRKNLHNLEVKRASLIAIAQAWKLRGKKNAANIYYGDASKIKKRIKSLAAIQAKLKHSIVTLG